jgi:hypothetical protein
MKFFAKASNPGINETSAYICCSNQVIYIRKCFSIQKFLKGARLEYATPQGGYNWKFSLSGSNISLYMWKLTWWTCAVSDWQSLLSHEECGDYWDGSSQWFRNCVPSASLDTQNPATYVSFMNPCMTYYGQEIENYFIFLVLWSSTDFLLLCIFTSLLLFHIITMKLAWWCLKTRFCNFCNYKYCFWSIFWVDDIGTPRFLISRMCLFLIIWEGGEKRALKLKICLFS